MASDELADSIDLARLPSGPRVLAQLTSLVRRPDLKLDDVASLLRSDPALIARVIAAANSPYYGVETRVDDFPEALLRLGISEVCRIVQIVALTDLRRYPTHLYTQTAEHFWARSLHTAFVIEELSGRDPMAYTAGIMHLVGVWVLCTAFPAGDVSIEERELALQARLEQLRLGVSFAEAGALALTRWGFPAAICDAVGRQLAPSLCEPPRHRELAILLSRAVAITDWHFGAKNEISLIRSDLTIDDLDACNRRAATQVARIGFGF